ncbi:hypothetical protein BH09PLA1_BH09PLA1_20470 [soil metagenome]
MPRKSPFVTPRKKFCSLETLEKRQLLSTVNITSFGALANDSGDDTSAINAAIRQSSPGDVIAVPAGTFNLSSTITLPSDRTLQGAKGSTLDFNVGVRDFAIILASGAQNVTITGLALKSNDGIILMNRGHYSNIKIINNDLQWGYRGTYYNRLAIRATSSSSGLMIEHNNFHDSLSSDRNVDLWNFDNSSYSYNTFYAVNDGGHLMNPGDNVKYSFNVGRLIHRMGIEIQQDAYPPTVVPHNFTVEGNIFYDWYKPYWDSMGLSVPLAGVATRIINNYIRQNAYQGVWGEPDSSGHVRGSYGIEGPQGTMLIAGNVVGGERNVLHVATPGKGTPVNDNHFYGPSAWGPAVSGEPGALGFGSFTESGNTWDRNFGNMPEPPTQLGVPVGDGGPVGGGGIGGGGTGGGGVDPNAPDGIATFLQPFVKDSSHITLTWVDTYSDEEGYRVERSLDAATWKTVYDSHAANITTYTDGGLPGGTVIYYRVASYKGDSLSAYSNIVVAKTKGIPGGGTGLPGAPGGGSTGTPRALSRPSTSPAPILDPLAGLNPQNQGLFSSTLL